MAIASVDAPGCAAREIFGQASALGWRVLPGSGYGIVGARRSKPNQPEQASSDPSEHERLGFGVSIVAAITETKVEATGDSEPC